MGSPYAGDSTAFPTSFVIPDDGDDDNVLAVDVAFEALGDRTAFLQLHALGAYVVASDSNATYQPATARQIFIPGSWTANRTVTLGTTNARAGDIVQITADPSLLSLAIMGGTNENITIGPYGGDANRWAKYVYDGSVWRLLDKDRPSLWMAPDANTAVWFRLDELSGNPLATTQAGVTYTPGLLTGTPVRQIPSPVGTGIFFPAINSQFTGSINAALPSSAITLSAWHMTKFDVSSDITNIVDFITSGGTTIANITANTSRAVSVAIATAGGGAAISNVHAESSGVWNHLAIVYNGTTLLAYANGVQVGTAACTGAISGIASNNIYRVGGGTYHIAHLADVRYETVARSAAYIAQAYRRGMRTWN